MDEEVMGNTTGPELGLLQRLFPGPSMETFHLCGCFSVHQPCYGFASKEL